MQHTLYLGLGSNLGDKQQNIAMAVEKIEELIVLDIRRIKFSEIFVIS